LKPCAGKSSRASWRRLAGAVKDLKEHIKYVEWEPTEGVDEKHPGAYRTVAERKLLSEMIVMAARQLPAERVLRIVVPATGPYGMSFSVWRA
jgi:hypothetical protein